MHGRTAGEWLVGAGSRQRLEYLGVVVGIALLAGMVPDQLVRAYIWLFGGIGIFIGAVAGARNYGLVTGGLGTALYIAVVGQAAFLVTASVDYSLGTLLTRGGLVLSVATLVVLVPSYLIGTVAQRRL